MSPDLLVQKQRRQAKKNAAIGKKTPAFKQPINHNQKQPLTFSLQLMKAVQELKENEGDDNEDLPSEVGRRIRHLEVANETEA